MPCSGFVLIAYWYVILIVYYYYHVLWCMYYTVPDLFKDFCAGSSEVPRNLLTRWDVSSIPANGIFLTKKLKNKIKNAQRVEKD